MDCRVVNYQNIEEGYTELDQIEYSNQVLEKFGMDQSTIAGLLHKK